MAVKLRVDNYCWTCGRYRRLIRASFMCEPCTESWASEAVARHAGTTRMSINQLPDRFEGKFVV